MTLNSGAFKMTETIGALWPENSKAEDLSRRSSVGRCGSRTTSFLSLAAPGSHPLKS